jgi:hypothetical protein
VDIPNAGDFPLDHREILFYICSMLFSGSPLTAELLQDAGPDGRFWYWRGASGRKYIHTVYAATGCPPLPGAVFVAVKRGGAQRTVLALGLIGAGAGIPEIRGCDEMHVHLLSRSPVEAEAVVADLRRGLAAIALPSPRDLAKAA